MLTIALAAFLRPFVLVLLLWLVVRPLADEIKRHIPRGKIRNLLLRRIS